MDPRRDTMLETYNIKNSSKLPSWGASVVRKMHGMRGIINDPAKRPAVGCFDRKTLA